MAARDRDGNFFYDEPAAYQAAWQGKQLPDAGAQRFAYETLALSPYTPIGRGIFFPILPKPTGPMVYQPLQTVNVVGIPTMAGQYAMQGLYNPENGVFAGTPIETMSFAGPRRAIGPNDPNPNITRL